MVNIGSLLICTLILPRLLLSDTHVWGAPMAHALHTNGSDWGHATTPALRDWVKVTFCYSICAGSHAFHGSIERDRAQRLTVILVVVPTSRSFQ
uniref:Putative secreted protein n=1 Tax=Anopheles marajoara TaxID=58244 RepID=A0A2M4C9H4_9DIPT